MTINKIAIIGSPGSGKSTLAKKLSQLLDLPLIHLDQHYLHGNWQVTPEKEWNKKIKVFASRDKWIIDGDYFSSLGLRLPAADMIIFFDIKRVVCLWRITKRMLTTGSKGRSDLPTECRERFDKYFIKFVKFVWNYHSKRKPLVRKKLEKYKNNKLIYIIKNKHDIKDLLQSGVMGA